MPQALGVLGLILLFLVGLALYWFAVVYIAIPLMLVTATVGVLAGAVSALVGAVRAFAGAEPDGLGPIVPDPHRRRSWAAPFPYRDDAWPHYLLGQGYRDVVNAAVWPYRWISRLTRNAYDALLDLEYPSALIYLILLCPLVLAIPAFLLGAAAGAVAAWVVTALLAAAVHTLGGALSAPVALVLIAADHLVRRSRGAGVVCPHCRLVQVLPAYRCACGRQHRDVRPGLFGVWMRRCRCGRRLPTTVVRNAAWVEAGRKVAVTPACPRCTVELPDEAGVRRRSIIAVSGAPGVGKTHLIRHALRDLSDRIEPEPAPPRPTDAPRRVRVHTGVLPAGDFLHMFDPAGETFLRGDVESGVLDHLGTTRRHVFVLDPLDAPLVEVAGESGARRVGVERLELPYRLMVNQIEQFCMPTGRCRLAVVISKMDQLWGGGAAQRLGLAGDAPPPPRDWLVSIGLDNLVLAAERDFRRVRYFYLGRPPVGYFPDLPEHFGEPVVPIRWLLSGVR
ncbi:hypothetical protein [Actinoplanes sp. HUAS TT8]|uniref:hypothetical protein n=1 Tax=Actinoplanes sp. HUAS TT8 TaxID=3447453 RepID=UPI003F52630E